MVEQPHVEQCDLENLRRIPKRRKKFRKARLLKISFEDFSFEWSHVPNIQISLTTWEAPCQHGETFLWPSLLGRFRMWYILNQVHSTRLLPKIYLPLVQNCKNLRRIPVLRVPSWLVCGLVPVHLRTRALSFFAAVIYYRISKTTSILVSIKSNKFPSSSFLQRKGDAVCWFALGNIQKVSFLFFFFICVVCNAFLWSPFDWVVNQNLWLLIIQNMLLSVN